MKYEIRAENGSLQRVTVEHGLIDTAPVLLLQQEIASQLPQIKLRPISDLHVTLFHFGVPADLYDQILRIHPDLEFKFFFDELLKLIARCDGLIDHEVKARAKSLDKFGGRYHPVIVLRLQDNPELSQARYQIEVWFTQFLRDLGVQNLDQFENAYQHYQFDHPFRPHVSLGRLADDHPLPKIPPPEFSLRLTPSQLRNVVKHG